MSFPRYPKYKDSGVEWLGEVPAHWGVGRLKQFAAITMGQSPSSDDCNVDGEGIPFLQGNADFGDHSPSPRTYCTVATKIAQPGDILLSVRAPVGAINVADQSYGIGRGLCALRPAQEEMGPFLRYGLEAGRAELHSVATGSTYDAVSTQQVGDVTWFSPPPDEQSIIASFLDRETAKIDELVAEQHRLMELLKEKRQAVISHAVTKGLNPDASMKPSGVEWLGEVPAHWGVHRVRTSSSFITSGPRGWSDRVADEGALFIQSGDLDDSLGVSFSDAKRVEVADDAESNRTRLEDGDVVVCITGAKTGNVAVCVTVPELAFINQHLCLIRPLAVVLPPFLGFVLKSTVGHTYFQLAQYGLKQGLSLEDVRDAPVPLPPITEQQEIVTFIETVSDRFAMLSNQATRAVALLHERRSALISAAATGQIDVRHLATEAAA
jgi:type I restriction enzyme S subunit